MANILLIEPDAVLAQVYARALNHFGHRTCTVATAQAGINAADDGVPDIVLLELQLVSHSGLEFLYEFRSYPEWQLVPVIILSHVPPGEFAKSIGLLKHRLNVSGYFYKPQTSVSKLLRAVDVAAIKQ